MKTCDTCHGEGGVTAENFGEVFSFECPDCGGEGEVKDEEQYHTWDDMHDVGHKQSDFI